MVGSQSIFKGTVFLNVQRTTLLDVLCHIEVVNEMFRLLNGFGADFVLDFLCNRLFFGFVTSPHRMVSLVLRKHFLESGTVLCTKDWIKQRGVSQLHFPVSDLLHKKSGIVQIDRIANLIIPRRCFFNRLCDIFCGFFGL